VRRDPGLVALVDGVVGFLTIERHFETSAEITWMAVHAEHRRQGIGSALIDRLRDDLRREGRRLLLVFTVSPSEGLHGEPEDGYGATRAFYAKADFTLARDFPHLWESDTAVLMVRVL
jgi:ribosomal protein S18 acetylase RimI-like enzyme